MRACQWINCGWPAQSVIVCGCLNLHTWEGVYCLYHCLEWAASLGSGKFWCVKPGCGEVTAEYLMCELSQVKTPSDLRI